MKIKKITPIIEIEIIRIRVTVKSAEDIKDKHNCRNLQHYDIKLLLKKEFFVLLYGMYVNNGQYHYRVYIKWLNYL